MVVIRVLENKLKLKTPVPPSVNKYLGKTIMYINKRPMVHIYETNEAKDFKNYVKRTVIRECQQQGWTKTGNLQYIICEVVAYMPQKKRDSDNILKCLLDAFTESDAIFYDDCMVLPRIKDIFIDSKNPRLEVTIMLSEKVGVFSSESQFEEFKERNCSSCSKFKRYGHNCKQLKDSLENRIIEDIDLNQLNCKVKK